MARKTTGEEAPLFKTWRTIAPLRGWIKGKKPKPEKKPRAATKPPTRMGKDTFGCRIGSAAAKINATLTATPQPVVRIIKATGLPPMVVSTYLLALLGKRLVTVSREGFALAK